MPRRLTDEQLAERLELQQVDRTLLDEAARRLRQSDLRQLLYGNSIVEAIRTSPLIDKHTAETVEKLVATVKPVVRSSSARMSSLASRTLRDPNATEREKSLAASVLSQDETPGQS